MELHFMQIRLQITTSDVHIELNIYMYEFCNEAILSKVTDHNHQYISFFLPFWAINANSRIIDTDVI